MMGELATEMDAMDSAKDLRGLDLVLKKRNGFRLGWIEVKTINQEPVVNPLSARFYRSDLKKVEFSKSAKSSSILFGEMPGELKSP